MSTIVLRSKKNLTFLIVHENHHGREFQLEIALKGVKKASKHRFALTEH